MLLAKNDHRPAVRSTYLVPLLKLHTDCRKGSVSDVSGVVGVLGFKLRKLTTIAAPFAAAEAALAAGAHRGTDCASLASAIGDEATGHLHSSGGRYQRVVRFSPPLTAELALAAIQHSLPGKVHVVYALTASACQQAIYMGPALGRYYGNAELGAFVELTSGAGVGHTRYDAKQVDRARITPLGRIGGEPCT